MLRRIVVVHFCLAALAAVGCSDSKDSPDLSYDPARAPIVFLPGLVASELGCGAPDSTTTSLWPGTASDISSWNPPFGDLALVNSGSGGDIESRTTSSAACGSESYRSGTAAEHEPRPLSPMWCAPEAQAVNPEPVSCPSFAVNAYSTFALGLAQQEPSDAKRAVVNFAWDWRKSPADQAKDLDETIPRVTGKAGVKAAVVAHSFGNILFREWMRYADQDGSPGDRVGRFLSVAGPWWGVAEAWTHPGFGEIQPGLGFLTQTIGTDSVKAVFQSAPGIYTLMPTRAYDDQVASNGSHWLAAPDSAGASKWIPLDDVSGVVEQQFTVCPQSDTFPCRARELYEVAAAAAPDVGFDTGGIRDFVGVVGAGMDTAGQTCSGCTVWPDGGGGDDPTGQIRYVNGGGNVPVFSAIQGTNPRRPPGDEVTFYFTCGISHIGLMTDTQVLAQTIPYVSGAGKLSHTGAFAATPCDLSPSS
ncbi:MAG: lipase/acyltransferase domain-containing protein [Actinomycetota bacterium]